MKLKFKVTGMTCAACSARVEKVTKAVPGVRGCEVNLLSGSMTAEAEESAKAIAEGGVESRATVSATAESNRERSNPGSATTLRLQAMQPRHPPKSRPQRTNRVDTIAVAVIAAKAMLRRAKPFRQSD